MWQSLRKFWRKIIEVPVFPNHPRGTSKESPLLLIMLLSQIAAVCRSRAL
jgi:hypothetical protein